MGGKKRKIPIEWIEDTNRRAVTFSKRRNGIYSKAAELCQLSGAQMAILVSPVSSQSHVSFYSFGHSSVDSVVSAFLNNERPPREDTVSKFWWEDESLAQSEDPDELRCAMNSISSMLHQVKALRAQKQREGLELVLHGNQTLDNIPSTSGTSLCPEDDYLGLDHVQGEEQITADNNNGLLFNLETQQLALQEDQTLDCDNHYLGLEGNSSEGQEQTYNNNNDLDFLLDLEQGFSLHEAFDFKTNTLMNLDMATMNQNPYSSFEQDGTLVMAHTDSHDGQLVSISDNNINLNQGFDFETNTQGTLMNLDMDDVSMTTTNHNAYSAFEEDGALLQTDSDDVHIETISDNNINLNQELDLDQINSELGLLEDAQVVVTHRDLDQDNLRFSDYFNDLPPITSHQELNFDQINSLEDVSMVPYMGYDFEGAQVVIHKDLDQDFFNDLTPIVAL